MSVAVSNVTTCETKIGFLLIEVFERFVNPQNDGHLDQIVGLIGQRFRLG